MSSKFFNNDSGNTLFDKLKGIASGMANFNRFLAVVGFFRSSGYFKLRKELGSDACIGSAMARNVRINFKHLYKTSNRQLMVAEIKETYDRPTTHTKQDI